MKRKMLCEMGPLGYKLSVKKGVILRSRRDMKNGIVFAREHNGVALPVLCKDHCSPVLRKLHGVDMTLQENKRINLILAGEKINGIIIHPGETFSFWELVGRPDEKDGYREGLTISHKNGFGKGVGGGLCQLANLIHWMVLHSPLNVTELHHHTDALFPDENRKVPFGTGTSVFYKLLDYRFYNNLQQDVQINVRVEGNSLCGELCSTAPFPCRYRLEEDDNHFVKEPDGYYRVSRVYRYITDKSGKVQKQPILDNHSKVMYDPALIPRELIR